MTGRGAVALVGCSLLSFVLGSVHAFSVFLVPLEQGFGAPRSSVSLTYSLALVSITLAVSLGYRSYGMVSGARFAGTVAGMAAVGAVLAGYAPSLAFVWIGYGVVFGLANGLGYGFGLQMSAQSNPGHEGLAMGLVTAAYGLGAATAPPLFGWALALGGFRAAMLGLAAALGVVGLAAAVLLAIAGARFRSDGRRTGRSGSVTLLWAAYGCAVLAGLMTMGHAAGIAISQIEGGNAGVTAPVLIAVFNMTGGLAAALLADRLPARAALVSLPVLSAMAMVALGVGTASGVLALLAVVGFCYGALIAIYPSAIARIYGAGPGVAIYARVFTAWGLAGLAGPWIAGRIFDASGGYATALFLAAAVSVVSALLAARLPTSTPTASQ